MVAISRRCRRCRRLPPVWGVSVGSDGGVGKPAIFFLCGPLAGRAAGFAGDRGRARVYTLGAYLPAGDTVRAGVRGGYSVPGRAPHAVTVEAREHGGFVGDGHWK